MVKVKHTIVHRLKSHPYGLVLVSKFMGDKTETKEVYNFTDEEARTWARNLTDELKILWLAESCELIQITRTTTENIPL